VKCLSNQMQKETIQFSAGGQAELIHAPRGATAREILVELNIATPQALVCLNGGTAELEGKLVSALEAILVDGLARVVAEEALTVITGGTDAGIFSLFGKGIEKWGRSTSVVGVVPEKLVKWPGGGAGDTALEPHHTHFVLTDGVAWGDETEAMYSLAREWSRDCPSVAVFAGGGDVTLREMRKNVDQLRPMILLAGSGRTTDTVLSARNRKNSTDLATCELATKGRIVPFALNAPVEAFIDCFRKMLAVT
jgi:hypothetical protein